MAVRLAVCGALRVVRDGEVLTGPRIGSRKARVLVAALASARGSPVSVDRLAELVWPDDPPHDPPANLATLVSRLRRSVGDGFVAPHPGAYSLGPSVSLDLDEAAALVTSAAARLARGEPTLAVAAADRALALVGDGTTLAAECEVGWAEALRQEAAETCREARHLLVAASIATDQPGPAATTADAAVRADPYDERAHRDLMLGLAAAGRQPAALEVYAALASRLAEDLGTDPDGETEALHLALLRGEDVGPAATASSSPRRNALVGRDEELARIDRAWVEAAAGRPSLVAVSGVPGIGKTRLLAAAAELAHGSGGLVLSTRCRPAERSLFLQPFLEVLRPVLLGMSESALATLLGGHLADWARLLPELRELFAVEQEPELAHDLVRRRSFDAVIAVLRDLSARQPVLLSVDDLQYGADVTADLLAHLATRLGSSRLLLLVASRTDGLPTLRRLLDVTEPLVLGPLPPSAVEALATAAGFSGRAAEVQARSQGHPLSVVASLQSLASGTPGVPADVATAVAGLVDLAGDQPAEVAAAASVLGTRVEPRVVAGMLDQPEVTVVLACESLVRAGLMTPAGDQYEFSNDLVQEAVLAGLPRALAVAYHRRAADLTSHRPEQMAGHAHEAGDLLRAAGGYLEAGRIARLSAALDDALALLGHAEADARASRDDALLATVLLERARAHEARTHFEAAENDVVAAQRTLQHVRDPRLTMRCLRLLGGDISVARRVPLDAVVDHNRAGLRRAAEIGDTVAQALFRSRIVVLECSRLRLREAHDLAANGLAESRRTGVVEAVARSLDGLKSVHAYCGDAASLVPVLDELLPLLHQHRLPWLLQWAQLESALVPASRGAWAEARACVDEALETNRRTGYGAYTGFFLAQRGWLARLAGEIETAVADGRSAVREASPTVHPWWYATAVGTYASTLLTLDRPDEAAELCTAGLSALGAEAGAAYRLRCLAPLAAATGQHLEETDRLVAQIDCAPGRAWVIGADVYDALAAAWIGAGEPERAAAVVHPLLTATTSSWRSVHERIRHRISASSPAARAAPSPGTGR